MRCSRAKALLPVLAMVVAACGALRFDERVR